MKGAWSVYPYFNSGTVLISSTEEGLFIVRPNLQTYEPCPRSVSGCDSSLYTNSFLDSSGRQDQYSKIKHIVRPNVPVGGTGSYVGRMSIPNARRRQVGTENVDISIDGTQSIHVEARVGLRNKIADGNSRYKFNVKLHFNDGLVASGKIIRLGGSAHDTFRTYSRYVDVPAGATKIERIEYRVIKPAKRGYKNALYLDSVAIEMDLRNVAAARTNANMLHSSAPRDSNLR